jgi:hypothetical protein
MGVAVIGFAFPLLLWAGGKINGISLPGSMSAYYHANRDCNDATHPKDQPPDKANACLQGAGPMRNWFVGILFVVGIIMYLYKGFTHVEDVTLNIAGVMAVCIALFPMSWTPTRGAGLSIHGISATLFFLCIAFVCEFCSRTTLSLMPDGLKDRNKIISSYKKRYRILAVLMLVSPLVAVVFNWISVQNSLMFWTETFGIWAFSAYWLVKTLELRLSEVEKRALQGELDNLDATKQARPGKAQTAK